MWPHYQFKESYLNRDVSLTLWSSVLATISNIQAMSPEMHYSPHNSGITQTKQILHRLHIEAGVKWNIDALTPEHVCREEQVDLGEVRVVWEEVSEEGGARDLVGVVRGGLKGVEVGEGFDDEVCHVLS